jgi:catechol 2,3-dioxygenase-like lactoylglutathione lyase family enzyme
MLESISHIALVVKNPAKTAALFHDLFSARVVEREDDEGHLETFVRLGGTWIVLLGAPVQRARTGDHIAFHATPEILEATVALREENGGALVDSAISARAPLLADQGHLHSNCIEASFRWTQSRAWQEPARILNGCVAGARFRLTKYLATNQYA